MWLTQLIPQHYLVPSKALKVYKHIWGGTGNPHYCAGPQQHHILGLSHWATSWNTLGENPVTPNLVFRNTVSKYCLGDLALPLTKTNSRIICLSQLVFDYRILFLSFGFGAMPGNSLGLFLALQAEITPGRTQWNICGTEDKSKSAMCKASHLPAVLSLWPIQNPSPVQSFGRTVHIEVN